MPIAVRRNIIPKWLVHYPIAVYIAALAVVSGMYMSHHLPWYYMLAGIVTVLLFFPIEQKIVNATSIYRVGREKVFEQRVLITAFVPRLFMTLLLYFLFQFTYGDPFGFDNADSVYYDELGKFVATLIAKGDFHFFARISEWVGNNDISDMGYGVYVGFVYWLTGNSIIAVRLLKCVWSTLTVLLVYRLAKRNFGEQTGRIAAIFCALWPNFWYYCSCHLKEVEMVFLGILFVEQADQLLRSRKFNIWKVLSVLVIAALIFTFRTPLGLVALLALVFSLVMSSSRVVGMGRRIIVGALAVALIGVTVGNRLEERAQGLIAKVQTGEQEQNMAWRAEREEGNSFAKYASSTVFAPMIFTLPFPTMVRPFEGQEVQQLNHGGNFVKNILSGFTILAVIMLLISGKWRDNLMPLSFMLGYLVVLTMSSFAHSERFHQPVMPIEFMFAAYGMGLATTKKKYKRWFVYWCIVMFVAAVAWNWFKMAGRGLG